MIVEKLKLMKLGRAGEIVAAGVGETLSYYAMPQEHWRCLRTHNPLERLMREIRRRTRVVGDFPDGKSSLMLVAAQLRHVAGTRWGTKCYLQMNRRPRSRPSPDSVSWPVGQNTYLNQQPSSVLATNESAKECRHYRYSARHADRGERGPLGDPHTISPAAV